jgi:hypothetical protein
VVVLFATTGCVKDNRAAARPFPPPIGSWSRIETSSFHVDIPPRWEMVQIDENHFTIFSPPVHGTERVWVELNAWTGTDAPASLEQLITRKLAEKDTKLVSRERVVVDGRPAERMVSGDADDRLLTTLVVVDANAGFDITGRAAPGAFERHRALFARIANGVHFFAQVNPHPPALPSLLVYDAKGDKKMLWLYPRPMDELTALAATTEAVVAKYANDETVVPSKVEVTMQGANGERVVRVIENRAP